MGTRVYLGRLSYHAREKDIERFFRGYGRIRDIMLKNGYGFVEFDDYRDADDAVYELNGKELCGERVVIEHARGSGRPPASRSRGSSAWLDKVSVEHARGPRSDDSFRDRGFRGRRGGGGGRRDKYGPPTRTDHRLIVENLSSRVSWQDLKDYMRQAGEVTYADAHKKHRNEGIIEFASAADLRNAIEKLDGTEINGRKIKLIEDKPRKHSRSRSRSRSRSHRRSRSRSASNSRSRSRSRSRSESKDKSKSRSASPSQKKSESRSRSRSRSKSRTPEMENGDQEAEANNDE